MTSAQMERAIKGLLEREDRLAVEIVTLKEIVQSQALRIKFLETEHAKRIQRAHARLDMAETTSLGRSRTSPL